MLLLGFRCVLTARLTGTDALDLLRGALPGRRRSSLHVVFNLLLHFFLHILKMLDFLICRLLLVHAGRVCVP